jgi:hypothetical protein
LQGALTTIIHWILPAAEIIGTVPGTSIKLTRVDVPFWDNTPIYIEEDDPTEAASGATALEGEPEPRQAVGGLPKPEVDGDGFGGLSLPSKYGNLLDEETNLPWPEDLWDYMMFRAQTAEVILQYRDRSACAAAAYLR